jgi:RND family efflux transporter MFP subunit
MEALEQLRIRRTPNTPSPGEVKPRRTRWLLLAGLLLAVAGMYFAFAGGFHWGVKVEIETVSLTYPWREYILFNATGYVVPQTKADVASKATGRLEALEVEEGSVVKKGDIIARVENQDVLASKARAKANAAVARAKGAEAKAELKDATIALERAKTLLAKKFIPQEMYDTASARRDKAAAAVESAEANVLAAEAAYEEAKVAVEYTLIRAPFAGVILEKHADIGDVVAPFSATMQAKGAVVSLADMNTLQVEADISEANLMQVRPGQPSEIQLDALPGERFSGRVHMIVPTVDRTKATVLVKVQFTHRDPRILPDMSARVAFLSQEPLPEEQQSYTTVGASAIRRDGNQAYVFRLNETTARKTPVALGKSLGDKIIVSRGLQEGDKVVANPPDSLGDGSRVTVVANI